MRSDSSCSSCHAPIRWAIHETTGRRMPLDPHPIITGNISIVAWRDVASARMPVPIIAVNGPERSVTPYRYVSHFATCPDSKSHRKR